jgi:hypothetical protein
MTEMNPVVRARIHERLPDGKFPYTFTFQSGSEHSDVVGNQDEFEAVLRDYGVSEIDVVFEGESRKQLMS